MDLAAGWGLIVLALGASYASGINLYATVLVLGLLDWLGMASLPPGLADLGGFGILAIAAGLYALEFVVDKIPGIDSLWDLLSTFVRIPAGALLASAIVAGEGQAEAGLLSGWTEATDGDLMALLALLGGGAVTTLSHTTKAASRAAINTSPEPFTNIGASVFEDFLAVAAVLAAVFAPMVFVGGLVVIILLAFWLLPKIWRGFKRLLGRGEAEVDANWAMVDVPAPEGASVVTKHGNELAVIGSNNGHSDTRGT